MQKISFYKNDFAKILTLFLLLLFKYLEMWSFLFNDKQIIRSKIIIITAVVFIIVNLLNMKIKKKRILSISILLIICLILTYISNTVDFLVAFLIAFIYQSNLDKEDSLQKFYIAFFFSSIFLFLTTIMLSFCGVLPKNTIMRYHDGIYYTRDNMGFWGPNGLFLCLFPILELYFLLFYEKLTKNKKIISIVIIVILSLLFYSKTNCRTGLLCIVVSIILVLCRNIERRRIFEFIVKYSMIIFLVLTLIMTIKFGKTTNDPINILSTGRLYDWNYYVNTYKYTLFGVQKTKTLDNLYLNCFYLYGIISYILILLISIFSFNKLKDNKMLVAVLFSFLIYGLLENNIAYNYNFILIIQLFVLMENKKNSKGKEKNESICNYSNV